ncbi:amino acid ABC transporter substrate-binding protein (PAAT family) [Stella humosa]|uniref:Amino acid ABC transporter substrate-binding protein (PAAT family) n=2 Tax=cellular organisms TaxID=131567 RepID=A0A3N1LHQ7_9PROT|nr:transporter substrate-binding domain-containing protein [Stella humosa]ROP90790.1 amino acid ABC transporter substrate-binding protein (PAAT family) [Stella humosa]BBK34864.1 ABC transporter substrate-binding protein [Stella humosa]
MRRLVARLLLLPLLLLPFMTLTAAAGALDDIVKRGTVKVGIDLGVPPYGLTDAQQKPAGYDVEVAEMLAKDLGVKLEIVPLTGPNRVPFLLTNKVDVVVATFGITPQRALSVSFSNPYVALSLVVLGPKDKPIADMASTKGMKVGITRGTTQDLDFTRLAPEGSQIIRFEDDATTTAALLSGQVDIIATADLLAIEIAKRNPAKNLDIKYTIRLSPGAIGVRRGDADFLQWVNTFVYFHKLTGDFGRLFEKWAGYKMPELPVF